MGLKYEPAPQRIEKKRLFQSFLLLKEEIEVRPFETLVSKP